MKGEGEDLEADYYQCHQRYKCKCMTPKYNNAPQLHSSTALLVARDHPRFVSPCIEHRELDNKHVLVEGEQSLETQASCVHEIAINTINNQTWNKQTRSLETSDAFFP